MTAESWRWGTVTALGTGVVSVLLDGDDDPTVMLSLGTPTVGARVWVQFYGRQVLAFPPLRT